MKITIIGTGNVGGALALAFKKAGHDVTLGVKDAGMTFKGKETAEKNNLKYLGVQAAVAASDVIVLATPAPAAVDVAKSLGDVSGKIIIDTMNGVFARPAGFANTADALLAHCNCVDIVKCFNTTGFENMANPQYGAHSLDMFVAGDSTKGKQVAMQLAKDIGFGHCYDFGGNAQFTLMEQFAACWINLAIIQKNGRDIGFKVLRRPA